MIYHKLKKIINLAPNNIEVNLNSFNALLSVLAVKDPLTYFKVIKAINFYNNKKYDLCLLELEGSKDKIKNNAYLSFKMGMCHFKKGNWNNAILYFEQAKKLKGYNRKWDIQYHAAKKNFKTKKINVNTLKDDYYSNKSDIGSLYNYASALVRNKSYWIAIHEINEYLEKNSINNQVEFLLADCYEKLTDHEKAIQVLAKLIDEQADNADYQYRMGFNLDCLSSEDADKYYKNFVNLKGYEEKELHFIIANINSKRGLWDKAIHAYCQYELSELQQLDEDFYLKRAYAYAKIFEWQHAVADYLKVLEIINYKNSDILYACAMCYEKLNNFKNASVYYAEAIKKSNDFKPDWYYRCAISLEKQGLHIESLEYYKKSKKNQELFVANKILDSDEKNKLAIYTSYYEELGICEKDVFIESFLGNNFSCNPLAITKKLMHSEAFKDFNFYIVLNDTQLLPNELIDDRVIIVKRESDLYLRKIASAKYLINNVSFPYYFIRKTGQDYLNTWHGTPLKTLGKDIKNPLLDHANVSRNFLQATHIISQNKYTNDILLDRYDVKNLYSGKIAETGYPRVDHTLNISSDRKQSILQQLDLDGSKPIVLYAPTWRGTTESKSFDVKKLIDDLTLLTSDEYEILFKSHHFAEKIIKKANLDVKLVDSSIDVNELLGCVDILVSDYSSIVFDYIKTKKPIISYVYDFDDYSQERGLYVTEDELVGLVVRDIGSLKNSIEANLGNTDFNYSADVLELVKLDDGQATQRVIDFFFNNDDRFEYKYIKKPVHLMYTGPYLPNGILKSFTNLVENLKNNMTDDLCIVFNRQDVLAHSNRKEEFLKNIRDDVSYHARLGAMLSTPEEAWVREKFENNFEKYSINFLDSYLKIYQREARRLFGDTEFKSIVNFEGYSLFWTALLSQMKSHNKIIFQHNDLYSEWKSKYPYLKGVFNLYENYRSVVSVSELTMINNKNNLAPLFGLNTAVFEFSNNSILVDEIKSKSQEKDDLLAEFKNFDGKKILNIGRLSHEKDQEKLIRAFKESQLYNNNCKLYILGQGYLKDHLEKLVLDLNLEGFVYLLGQVSNPYAYMEESDLFVLSSNHEGQPMVLLEALTLGTQILATDIVGNRSILNGMDYLLCENNLESLRDKMCSRLNSIPLSVDFDVCAYNDDAVKKIIKLLEG